MKSITIPAVGDLHHCMLTYVKNHAIQSVTPSVFLNSFESSANPVHEESDSNRLAYEDYEQSPAGRLTEIRMP